MKKRLLSILLILCLVCAMLPAAQAGTADGTSAATAASPAKPQLDPFKDSTMHWGRYPILWAAQNGYVNGTSSNKFSPNKSMTRCMFVTVLHRYEGIPVSSYRSPFTDVAAGAYYEQAVKWAAENGLIEGTSSSTFSPNNNITRQDIAVLMRRYQEFKQNGSTSAAGVFGYPDSGSVSAYAKDAVGWAVSQELIQGKNGLLAPRAFATRAEVVTILQRMDSGIGPVLYELIPIPSTTADSTPSYAFYSSVAGTVTCSGGITSPTKTVAAGENYLTFSELTNGTYRGCSVTVTDANGRAKTLTLPDFTVNAAPSGESLRSHINTFGFDYDDHALGNPEEAAWIAERHDTIVTGTVQKEAVYDTLRSVNPNISLIGYISMYTNVAQWLENWCAAREIDPESLYYHYETDTVLQTLDGTVTIPGYGKGSAKTLKEARVRTFYSAGYPVYCPTSATFREAFTEYAWTLVTVNADKEKYIDGLFMDGYVNNCWEGRDVRMENTIEMRKLGKTTSDSAKRRYADDMVFMRDRMEQQISAATGQAFTIPGASSEVNWIFEEYSYLFADKYNHIYNSGFSEFFTDYIRCRVYDISKLEMLYEGFEAGQCYYINSGTHYPDRTKGTADTSDDLTQEEWDNYIQFLLASQYLVNHENGNFAFHIGSGAYYGGQPKGTFKNTHWHKNIEFDVGTPVTRDDQDYWGATGTNRFYVLDEAAYVPGKGIAYKVLAREYENALVIAKFGGDSYPQIGREPLTHPLPGEYRRLLPDNSLGPVITEIKLGQGGGAILIKAEQG